MCINIPCTKYVMHKKYYVHTVLEEYRLLLLLMKQCYTSWGVCMQLNLVDTVYSMLHVTVYLQCTL